MVPFNRNVLLIIVLLGAELTKVVAYYYYSLYTYCYLSKINVLIDNLKRQTVNISLFTVYAILHSRMIKF